MKPTPPLSKCYLVGGAVRDQLLGLPIKERDFVVVGATADDMLALGYRPVGKDFPVFLHPETKEEYALARTERKSGKGYKGFVVDASPSVTLEEDLMRRDLTINAIAQSDNGTLIDPFNGQRDLHQKTLRHVSSAFTEDPLRVLRVARFMARFSALGFTVAPETLALMKDIAQSGELNALVPERIWKEWQRSLTEKNPEQFLKTLEKCNALSELFPELHNIPEVILRLARTAKKTSETHIRFAAMLSPLSQEKICALCQRTKIPTAYTELAKLVSEHLVSFQNAPQLNAADIFALFQKTDALRKPARFRQYLLTCECITQTRNNLNNFLKIARELNTSHLINKGLSGKLLGNAIAQARIDAIKHALNENKKQSGC